AGSPGRSGALHPVEAAQVSHPPNSLCDHQPAGRFTTDACAAIEARWLGSTAYPNGWSAAGAATANLLRPASEYAGDQVTRVVSAVSWLARLSPPCRHSRRFGRGAMTSWPSLMPMAPTTCGLRALWLPARRAPIATSTSSWISTTIETWPTQPPSLPTLGH